MAFAIAIASLRTLLGMRAARFPRRGAGMTEGGGEILAMGCGNGGVGLTTRTR